MKKVKSGKMSSSDPLSQESLSSFVGRFFGLMMVLIGILFIPAGRLNWWQAWRFIGAYAVFVIAFLVRGLRKDPGQIKERSQTGKNVKAWDKVLLTIYSIFLLGMLILAALDAGRFRWAPLSFSAEIIGWMLIGLAGGLILWTASVNTFLSRQVRIQEERGHYAVTSGPYRWVRHPMYAGLIIFIFCVPLLLGSGLAMIPAALIGILIVIRTSLEDKTLQAELPGYKEYVQKVHYRLLPGIW
jgi:protein-S-isoprenylcysteine O-methyltransferase Ste14